MIAGYREPFGALAISVFSGFKLPVGPCIQHDLVVAEPGTFLKGNNFELHRDAIPLVIAIKVGLSKVEELKIVNILIFLNENLSFIVELWVHVCDDRLDESLGCMNIVEVIIEEELEAVNHIC